MIDDLGAANVVRTLGELAGQYGDRFRPCTYLESIAAEGKRFYEEPGNNR